MASMGAPFQPAPSRIPELHKIAVEASHAVWGPGSDTDNRPERRRAALHAHMQAHDAIIGEAIEAGVRSGAENRLIKLARKHKQHAIYHYKILHGAQALNKPQPPAFAAKRPQLTQLYGDRSRDEALLTYRMAAENATAQARHADKANDPGRAIEVHKHAARLHEVASDVFRGATLEQGCSDARKQELLGFARAHASSARMHKSHYENLNYAAISMKPVIPMQSVNQHSLDAKNATLAANKLRPGMQGYSEAHTAAMKAHGKAVHFILGHVSNAKRLGSNEPAIEYLTKRVKKHAELLRYHNNKMFAKSISPPRTFAADANKPSLRDRFEALMKCPGCSTRGLVISKEGMPLVKQCPNCGKKWRNEPSGIVPLNFAANIHDDMSNYDILAGAAHRTSELAFETGVADDHEKAWHAHNRALMQLYKLRLAGRDDVPVDDMSRHHAASMQVHSELLGRRPMDREFAVDASALPAAEKAKLEALATPAPSSAAPARPSNAPNAYKGSLNTSANTAPGRTPPVRYQALADYAGRATGVARAPQGHQVAAVAHYRAFIQGKAEGLHSSVLESHKRAFNFHKARAKMAEFAAVGFAVRLAHRKALEANLASYKQARLDKDSVGAAYHRARCLAHIEAGGLGDELKFGK